MTTAVTSSAEWNTFVTAAMHGRTGPVGFGPHVDQMGVANGEVVGLHVGDEIYSAPLHLERLARAMPPLRRVQFLEEVADGRFYAQAKVLASPETRRLLGPQNGRPDKAQAFLDLHSALLTEAGQQVAQRSEQLLCEADNKSYAHFTSKKGKNRPATLGPLPALPAPRDCKTPPTHK